MKKIFISAFLAMLSLGLPQKGFSKDPFDNPLYNTLYSKDCTIPEQAQIIHYPMVHPEIGTNMITPFFIKPDNDNGSTTGGDGNSPDDLDDNSHSDSGYGTPTKSSLDYSNEDHNPDNADENMISNEVPNGAVSFPTEDNSDYAHYLLEPVNPISYSTFQLIQLLKKHPSALVFDEVVWTESTVNMIEARGKLVQFLSYFTLLPEPFKNIFKGVLQFQKNAIPLIYANSYQDLGKTEKHILSQSTGGIASIMLGIIDEIYPATNLQSIKQSFKQYQEQYNPSFDTIYCHHLGALHKHS